jgi:hypothetical protein
VALLHSRLFASSLLYTLLILPGDSARSRFGKGKNMLSPARLGTIDKHSVRRCEHVCLVDSPKRSVYIPNSLLALPIWD